MKDLALLIQAISSLLWPILSFVALYLFREQLITILSRLKKGKFLGQEIELNETLEKLQHAAQDAAHEVANTPSPIQSEQTKTQDSDISQRIISEAAISPKAALISLASELERLGLEVLSTTGRLQGRNNVPISSAINEIHLTGSLPSHIPSSLKYFLEVRHRLIHRGEGSADDVLRAIDSGLSILKALQAIPRERSIIHTPLIKLYSDQTLTNPLKNIHGVLLETHSPGGTSKRLGVYPTKKNDYIKGKQVSWEWNTSSIFGQAWYRDIDSDESQIAWHSSAEFIGRHIDEIMK